MKEIIERRSELLVTNQAIMCKSFMLEHTLTNAVVAAAFSFPAAVVDTADVVAATVVTFSEVPPVSVFPHDTIADIIVSIARQVTFFFIINSPLFFVQRSNLSLLTMSL